ncbi:MAG TPA: tetratricopeptide repeat protein, partial [Rhodanobacteraceae bacterium]|nr:tetratricopeptide repeat protein [Rhodanobacteraceae bacterium]
RRNVIRMAGLYLVGAWLLTQVASTLLPVFDVPGWALRGLVIVLALGFVPALIVAWVFELTPQGLRRDDEVKPEQSIAPQTARRMDRMIIIVLSIALVYFGFDKFVLAPRREAAIAGSVQKPDASPNSAKAGDGANDRSIAVLPFENLSADKDNEYFASGMQDMILTKLADIRELKVISRTSTEKYKSHPDNLKTIARELGVAKIVEGSVQKAGSKVLINVQLIDVATDQHLWAQAYTRTLDDIFGVEGEVATMIAEALKTKLSPAEAAAVAKVPTQNQQAYEAYLKAKYYVRNANRTYDRDELASAVPLLQQAVQQDPRFGKAYSLLALVYTKLRGHAQEQQAAARKALEIDPNDADALDQMAFLHSDLGEHDKAIEFIERAVKSAPGAGNVQSAAGWTYAFAGRFEESAKAFARLLEIDPSSSAGYAFHASPLMELRRYAQAREGLRLGLARDPDNMVLLTTMVDVEILGWGDLDAARKLLKATTQTIERSIPLAGEWYTVNLLARDYPAALAVLEQAPAGFFTQSEFTKAHYQARVFQVQDDHARAHKAWVDAREQMRIRIKAEPDQATLHASLALALAGSGECDEALGEARLAVQLEPVSRNAVFGPRRLDPQARVSARCGRVDEAIDQLRHLLQIPAGEVVSAASLRLDPDWDPIRADPRFQSLLEKYSSSEPKQASVQ